MKVDGAIGSNEIGAKGAKCRVRLFLEEGRKLDRARKVFKKKKKFH